LALVLGTIAGYSPWDNLAPLCGKKSERTWILVVNHKTAVRTKAADLSPAEHPLAPFKPCHL
jgi:hypothetical protein